VRRAAAALSPGGTRARPQSLVTFVVLGQRLARLPSRGGAQRLDAWLKGPVYHGSGVRLRASTDGEGTAFALVVGGEERPAIVGRWRAAGPAERLPTVGTAPA
jgi:hypothetical protein